MTGILIDLDVTILLILLIFGYFLIRLYVVDVKKIRISIENLRKMSCLFYDKDETDTLLENMKADIAVTYSKKRKRKKS